MPDYKSLYAAFTICAPLFDPKLEFYVLTRVASKK